MTLTNGCYKVANRLIESPLYYIPRLVMKEQ